VLLLARLVGISLWQCLGKRWSVNTCIIVCTAGCMVIAEAEQKDEHALINVTCESLKDVKELGKVKVIVEKMQGSVNERRKRRTSGGDHSHANRQSVQDMQGDNGSVLVHDRELMRPHNSRNVHNNGNEFDAGTCAFVEP
jgi:hypothetical protein